jgi:polygalacturonase
MNRREIVGYAAASAAALTIKPSHVLGAPKAKAATGTYNVKDFGATGDGKTLDTQAINKTIEACSTAGGGTVQVSAGVYLTGTVHLKSNINLQLDAGATLLGSKDLKDYDDIFNPERNVPTLNPAPGRPIRKEGFLWHAAVVVGQDLRKVAITGRGTIDGNKVFNAIGEESARGPHAIFFSKCEGILIQDIFVKDASNYAHLMEDCSNGNLRGVTVTGGWDGIDLFNCKDIIITDCHFMTGDDCVAGGGWERLVVANCMLNTACSGVRNYGGGMKNVLFTNLVIAGPGIYEQILQHRHDLLAGFLITSGGVVDNLVISNVSVSNCHCPLWLGAQNPRAAMRNVSVSNLTATGVGKPGNVASIIQGTKDNPVESISLSNIKIVSEGGGTKDLIDKPFPVTVRDPYMSVPCYGLFCRQIKDLELHNVRFSYAEQEARPALICESVERLELDGVRGQAGTENESSIVLRDIGTLRRYRDAEVSLK